MNMNRNYGAVLLAGGAGRRMGNIDKAGLFRDQLLAELTATGLCCFYSYANYPAEPISGWIMVKDNGVIGPMGAIHACLLEARKRNLHGLFAVPCDAPGFKAIEITELSKHINQDSKAAVWQQPDGRLETTFAYYSTELIKTIEDLIASRNYKLSALFTEEDIIKINSQVDQVWFRNINTQEEYREVMDEK